MTKLETYGAGYGGLLSNSQLQAAIICPVKYDLMYRKGIRPDKDGLWFNAAFVGNVVHKCIELHDDDHAANTAEMWSILTEYFGEKLINRTQKLMVAYQSACDSTREEGKRWGKVYKAPEMTSFFKKNYGGILQKMQELNADAEAQVEGSVFEEPWIDLITRAVVCLENWKDMRIAAPVAAEIKLIGIVGEGDDARARVGTLDRLEVREGGRVALTDFKTGRWAYDKSDLQNSDAFGLYHRLLEQSEYGAPVEWVIYNLYTKTTIVVDPTEKLLSIFDNRNNTNQRYFKQLETMLDAGVQVPTPAGSSFKTGCPCILSQTGHCPFVFMEGV